MHCLIAAVGLLRLYDLFQPGIDPWQLVVAQILVPGIAVFSAGQLFLSGVRKNLRTAMARRKSNHSIVCGIGDVGMQIVQNLRAAHHLIVAIDLQGDSPNAATCEKAGVPVLQGDAKSPSRSARRGNPPRANSDCLHWI
ncbi:MAG: NAD-binding protein [Terracidiphilus sp.]